MTSPIGSLAADFATALAQVSRGAAVLAGLATAGAWDDVAMAAVPQLTTDLFLARDLLGSVANAGVGVVHAGGVLPGGHVSTTRWLEVATGMSGSSASAQVARSRALRTDFPRTRLAWLAGQVSEDMVRVITTGIPVALQRLDVAASSHTIASLEATLVPYATTASIRQVTGKLARLRVVLDPDGVDARALAAYDDQQLRLTPVGDGFEVRGYLAKETAAALLTCLDQTVDGWFRTGSLAPEDQSTLGDDSRSRGQRRLRRDHLNALALAELCERMLDESRMGSRHQQRPHLTVTVDAEEYRAGHGGELGIPGREPEHLSAASIDRILCDADVTTVLTRPATRRDESGEQVADWLADAAREVLYVGQARRTAPPRLRRALAIRDRHCAFSGCRADPTRCHAHHVTHWEDGGGTALDSMVLLCHGHHHLVHEGRWTVTATPGARPGEPGCWTFSPPVRQRTP